MNHRIRGHSTRAFFRLARAGLTLVVASFVFAPSAARAAGVPHALSVGGALLLPDGSPVTLPVVNFRVEIRDPSGSCVLYSENHLAENLSVSDGYFNLIIGAGSGSVNNVSTTTTLDASVFTNRGTTTVANCAASPVVLNTGDDRSINISYDLGSGYVAMSPAVPVVSSAYAMVAETLEGYHAADFLQVNATGSSGLTQANTEYAFSGLNWPRLKALIDGTSSQYFGAAPGAPIDFNTQRAINVGAPTQAADAANKAYVDQNIGGRPLDVTAVGPMVGNGSTLLWDATANKWVAGSINTSATGTAGGDLIGTYPSPTIRNDVITSAKIKSSGGGVSRLLITDATTGTTIDYGVCALNEVYAWTATGWACTTIASLSPVASVAGKTGVVTLNAGDINNLGTAALLNHGTAAGEVPQLLAGGALPILDGSALTQINAVKLQTRSIASTAPNPGQVLGWNAAASAWEPTTVASSGIQSLATGTGLVGGVVTTNGTLSVDVGINAGQILQLNGSAKVPAVDGSLLTQINAVSLQSRAVAATAPAQGQVLGWNNVSSSWEPILAASGSVINISSGLGLLGGPIATSGTLSVDVGTAPNQILQLNAGARVPAVDGSLLTFVNAVRLQSRAVSTVAPVGGQTLAFNAVSSQWEPSTAANGTVTNVATGSGLVGGPISTSGTIAVDTGTTAGKIVQLDAGARLPTVDGSALTSVNATKLQQRAVAATAPTPGQILGWNAGTSAWEPTTGAAGSVTTIASGLGLLGGPISANGTLSVDVGTGANKIVQLNAGAQLPGVDGSLLTFVNAVRLQSRPVSAAAPAGGQTLAFNAALSQWEPATATVGTVTNVATGNGLLGGPISVNGTLAVDTGTTANKIVQLNAGAQIPAIDGSLLTFVNAVRLQTRAVAVTAPNPGQVLGWNATSTQWEPVSTAVGSVTSVNSGTGLTGGPITANGTLNVDVGTTANKIVQLNAGAQVPAVDGSLLTFVNAVRLQQRAVAATAPGAGQILGWNASTSLWEPTNGAAGSVTTIASGVGLLGGPISSNGTLNVDVGTGANKIVQLNGSAQLPPLDGSLLGQVNAVKLQTRAVAFTAPTPGQVLGWNASTTTWEPVSTAVGSVTNVASGTGLLGGPITSNGTLNVDVGTGANKIVQLNGSAQLPAVDGSLLAQVNAVRLQSRVVAATAPTAGQTLAFNATLTQWEPSTAAGGTVLTVASGLGLLGGPISSNGTLSVDVGTGANKILQLNASAQVPAVDGSLLTQVNAVRLQTRAVAITAPTPGQVLGWNASTTTWEPVSTAVGSVTNVAGGTGLLGGPITSNGTLNVDVGTTANKIVQLNASAQLPAVDGSLLTQVNAVRLQSRTVASTAPTAGQTLAFNATLTQWEPSTVAGGTVTNVATGTGLLGGPITSNGTLNVDVGTGANKIVQLNGSAQLPIIDGSLLTQVNAVRLQARVVSATAPNSGQVLGWNASTSVWEPTSGSVGSVTNVASGIGLTGGPITSNGTLNVDVGTGANKIVQLNGSAQLPIVDGSLLTQVNAVKLQSRNVAATAPTAGQTLAFNATLTQWEPSTAAGGSVTNVASGTGLLGGPITSNGTLNVDVGTSANKIVQLNGSAQLPIIDGSLLTQVNAVRLQARAVSASAPNSGQVLGWNASTSVWEPTSGSVGSVTNVASGVGLTGGPITSNGTLNVDVGTGANKIVQLNGSAQVPAVDGSLLLQVNAVRLQSRNVAATAPTAGQTLAFNATLTQWEPSTAAGGSVTNVASGTGLLGGPISSNGTLSVDVGTAANKIVQLNASAQVPALDGSLLTQINAVRLQTRAVSNTAPNSGQVLGWNASTSVWEPTSGSVGSVTNVASGIGLTGGPITSNGTLNVDVGTGANKIVQLNGSAQLPVVDGSQLTQVNAIRLQTRAVAATAPSAGQILAFNATLSQWEPSTASAGTVTNVATGTGLLGGPISSNGTLSVDVGTTANKIVQLTGGAQVPALDGSLLTQINAVKLQTRAIAATAPNSGQVLGWNASTSVWEPTSGSVGSVTNVVSGIGLTGGPITSNGTLNVDVGTAANKIVQLNASAQLPAVDGSLLMLVNAFRLQTRSVSAAAPSAGQVLGWNAATTTWEPAAASAGTVTNVAGGTGLLGGPVTSNGTLSVDVGTTANKIVQLNASAQVPALDGSLLTQINAVRLQARAVSAAAPNSGQVLGWNASTSVWEPTSGSVGSVTNVASGIGLLGGPITTNGTLNVDVGSAANKIVQENANAQIAQTLGTVGLPSYSFAGNTNTGLFSPGANQLALSTNGTAGLTILANGSVGIGTSNPAQLLEVAGAVRATSFIVAGGAAMQLSSNGLSVNVNGGGDFTVVPLSGPSFYVKPNGWVGIGSNAPLAALDVNITGTSSAIVLPRDTTANRPTGVNGMLRYNNTLNVMEGYINGAWASLGGGAGVTGSGTTNYVPKFTGASAIGNSSIYDAGSGRIAIGTTSASSDLSFDGNASRQIAMERSSTATANPLTIQAGSTLSGASNGNGGSLILTSGLSTGAGGSSVEIRTATPAASGTNDNVPSMKVLITSSGAVGVGTNNPLAALDVTALGATSALVIPRDTTTNRPSGTNGMMRYNTTSAKFEAFENGAWTNVISAGGGGGSIGCGDYSANQVKLISSTNNYWAPFCFIGSTTSFQNTNWVGRTATNHAAATLACANEGADLCSASDVKKVYGTSAGSSGLGGVQMWTSTMGYVSQVQNPTTCSSGNCQPQEWQPYVFNNGNFSNGHTDLAQQQYQYFCCRH